MGGVRENVVGLVKIDCHHFTEKNEQGRGGELLAGHVPQNL